MYTRLITWTNATNIDGGIEYLRDTALPIIHQQKGYRGLSATVDRSTGRLHILTIWESEADRDASDGAMSKARDEATEIIGGAIQVERLEELVSEVVKPPVPGSALMVSPFSMNPATIDEELSASSRTRLCPRSRLPPGSALCATWSTGTRVRDTSELSGPTGLPWTSKPKEPPRHRAARGGEHGGITFGEIRYLELVLVDSP